MNYSETTRWLFSQLPLYQNVGKSAYKADLSKTLKLAKQLNHPEFKFKSVHVGGTNGKGSTAHMLASVLQEAGYKVGLYTSPHLKDYRERIRINGQMISKDFVVDFVAHNKSFFETNSLSFFEMSVGMAFAYFADEQVDIAVVEVGLGGRLDSTNILNPEVSVITNIGLDHTHFLGETLPEIAYEKAGIIKEDTPVIIGEEQLAVKSVFIRKAAAVNAPISFASVTAESYPTDLLGEYQKKNVKTAVSAIRALQGFQVSETAIKAGLLQVVKNTNLKGRWQILQVAPMVLCDTAHNAEGLAEVFLQLRKEKYAQLHFVFGVVSDKKLEDILPLFPVNAQYYFCKPDIPRGLSEVKLQEKAAAYGLLGAAYPSTKKALEMALLNANQQDIIYVGGSTFVVAEII
jgi:dihydrofolate synthase/folylpolyglutamate synthase